MDDHSKVLKIHVTDSKGVLESLACFEKFVEKYGQPEVVQTDNGTEFTNKYVSEFNPKRLKEARRGAFELELERRGIRHYLIPSATHRTQWLDTA